MKIIYAFITFAVTFVAEAVSKLLIKTFNAEVTIEI